MFTGHDIPITTVTVNPALSSSRSLGEDSFTLHALKMTHHSGIWQVHFESLSFITLGCQSHFP